MSKFRAPSAPDTRPGASQSGLSLVELLIATALGLILTLGVIQIYLNHRLHNVAPGCGGRIWGVAETIRLVARAVFKIRLLRQ